jgi:hypothetical protein
MPPPIMPTLHVYILFEILLPSLRNLPTANLFHPLFTLDQRPSPTDHQPLSIDDHLPPIHHRLSSTPPPQSKMSRRLDTPPSPLRIYRRLDILNPQPKPQYNPQTIPYAPGLPIPSHLKPLQAKRAIYRAFPRFPSLLSGPGFNRLALNESQARWRWPYLAY